MKSGRPPAAMSSIKKKLSLTLGRTKSREHSYTGIADEGKTSCEFFVCVCAFVQYKYGSDN